jgi:hypothetical protein
MVQKLKGYIYQNDLKTCQTLWNEQHTGDSKPCYGATWEEFQWQLWIPLFWWIGFVIFSIPLRKFYFSVLNPKERDPVEKRQSFVLRYIGTPNSQPLHGQFFTAVLTFQIVASLWETFVAAGRTYAVDEEWGTKALDYILCVFFIFAFALNAIKAGFSMGYCFSLVCLVDVFTIIPILFSSVNSLWLSLKFLRVYRSLAAYENLEKTGFLEKHVPEMTRAGILMLLKTVALVMTMAGIILIVETLGEPEFLESTVIPTAMGEISFWQMMYWIFTTISTVGYGDYSPQTNLSRFFVIVFIIVGVTFFSLETGRIIDISRILGAGHGKYTGRGGHIVLIGGGVRNASPSVRRFLSEISLLSKNIVMLSTVEINDQITSILTMTESNGRFFYFQGSPMEEADLERVQIKSASMAFVIANLTTQDPDEEDRANILRAVNLYRTVPGLRLRVMIIRPGNKMMAYSMGLPIRSCCSVNELKGNLLAQSCRLPGYSTLLLNLCLSDQYSIAVRAEPSVLEQCEAWRQQYFKGNNIEVIGIVINKRYAGMPFWEAASQVLGTTGDLLIAVQELQGVMVFPCDRIMEEGDTVFVLSEGKASVALIAELQHGTSSPKWKNVVDYRASFRLKDGVDAEARMKDLLQYTMKEERTSVPLLERRRNPKTMSTQKQQGGRLWIPGFARSDKGQKISTGSSFLDASGSVQREGGLGRLLSETANAERNKDRSARIVEEAAEAMEMVSQKGHILLLLQQPEMQWQQVVAFVRPLRAEYLPSFRNIVVMGPGFPPAEMWDMFEDVAFVEGNPESRDDLENMAAADADKVVLLAGPPNPDLEARLADGNAMVVNSILESIFKDAGVDRFSVFEYTYPGNALILPPVPVCAQSFQGDASEGALPEDSSLSSPRFAAGRLITPSLFGSLFANAYSSPGILELFEALVMPGRRGQHSFPYMLPPLERVAPEWVGHTYGELCTRLLQNGLGVLVPSENSTDPGMPTDYNTTHCLPLGLYRRVPEVTDASSSSQAAEHLGIPMAEPVPGQHHQNLGAVSDIDAAHQGMRFVYTNPEGATMLLPGDQVYIIAPSSWGGRVTLEAEMAVMGTQQHPIFEQLQSAPTSEVKPNSFTSSVVARAGCGVSSVGQPVLPDPGVSNQQSAAAGERFCGY